MVSSRAWRLSLVVFMVVATWAVTLASRATQASTSPCEMGIWQISIVSVKVDGELDPALMSLPGGWPAEQELRGFPQYVFLSGLREESRLKLEPAFCDTGYWCD